MLGYDITVSSNSSYVIIITFGLAQLAGAVEYTDCTSAKGQDSFKKCPGSDTKQSDAEAPVILELWGMQSMPSLPSLPGPFGSRIIAPDRALTMG